MELKNKVKIIFFVIVGTVISQEVLASVVFHELFGTVAKSARKMVQLPLVTFAKEGSSYARFFSTGKMEASAYPKDRLSDLLYMFETNCLTQTREISPELGNIGQLISANAETLSRMKAQDQATRSLLEAQRMGVWLN